jgi:hypothetical protein
MNTSGAKDFTRFGKDVQDMIITQLQAIELDKIGPKSIGTVGKSLIKIIEQSHHFQEEVDDVDSRDNWIAIREMSLIILEEILNRFRDLSDQAEIAEWDRAAVISLLSDISKVCHNEQKRTQAKLEESLGKELSDELLNEILGS